MRVLKIGDELVHIFKNRISKESTYTFRKVVRLTSTRAVLDDGTAIVNEERSEGQYKQYGHNCIWIIVTKEIRSAAAREDLLGNASTWYWSKYKRQVPSREDLLFIKNCFEEKEKAEIPLSEIEQEVMNRIYDLEVDCPECESMEDDQYHCTMCGNQGGYGRLNVHDFLKERKLPKK